jgi:hypothetical protein
MVSTSSMVPTNSHSRACARGRGGGEGVERCRAAPLHRPPRPPPRPRARGHGVNAPAPASRPAPPPHRRPRSCFNAASNGPAAAAPGRQAASHGCSPGQNRRAPRGGGERRDNSAPCTRRAVCPTARVPLPGRSDWWDARPENWHGTRLCERHDRAPKSSVHRVVHAANVGFLRSAVPVQPWRLSSAAVGHGGAV